MVWWSILVCALASVSPTLQPAFAAVTANRESAPKQTRLHVTAPQLLSIAAAAQQRGDFITAEMAYRSLASDPDVRLRAEARFRLGMMLASAKRFGEAAVQLRHILDEQPRAQRVRLELARLLDLMGDDAGARRALREAQAGGLPPDVVRFVDRYSAALRARKPFGASFEMAVAPDSNINRATRSDTLGTVIGDFILDEDAKQRSGVGLAVRGQTYARLRLGEQATIIGRLSSAADVYRDSDFNDLSLGISAGPELAFGRHRLAIEAGVVRRWFGGEPLASTATLSATYSVPIGRVSQLRASVRTGTIDHRLNRLQGGRSHGASLGYERALSPSMGVAAMVAVDRQALRDPGYATRSAQITAFAYREFGATTVVGSLGHSRLAADERLFIYPERRRDRLVRATLGATFRQLEAGGFAPFARVTREINRSSIEIFDYRRTRTEFGIERAF